MRTNLSRTFSHPQRCLGSCGIAAALLTCLVLNIAVLMYQLNTLISREPSYTYIGDDRPRDLPIKHRLASMIFHDDPSHYHLDGIQAWAEWTSIRPAGRGYVYLGESYFSFGVSMWHQMHCLDHIRTILVLGDDGSDHTEHCFHYLRQGILCAADTTLEPGGPSMLLESGGRVATGVNVTHTCRDWKQVYDWMEENHSTWTPEMKQRMKEPSDGHGGRVEKMKGSG